MSKFPDHLDESIYFGGVAVIGWGEVPHRGLQSRNEHGRVRQASRIDNLRHDYKVPELAMASTVTVRFGATAKPLTEKL